MLGTIPSSVCAARSLNILSLDGLTSSTACVQRLWDPLHYFYNGYFARSMRGTYCTVLHCSVLHCSVLFCTILCCSCCCCCCCCCCVCFM
jgi:ABC-type thiamin/hydroxymethylpyrimidine transport system permease subunit